MNKETHCCEHYKQLVKEKVKDTEPENRRKVKTNISEAK